MYEDAQYKDQLPSKISDEQLARAHGAVDVKKFTFQVVAYNKKVYLQDKPRYYAAVDLVFHGLKTEEQALAQAQVLVNRSFYEVFGVQEEVA